MTWVFYILLLFIKQVKSFKIDLLLIIGRGKKKGRDLLDCIPGAASILPKQPDCPHLVQKFFSMKQPTFVVLIET